MNSVFVDDDAINSGQKKLVGVYISKTDADRLALLSLEKGVPRTALLRDMVTGYLQDKPNLPTLITSAMNRAVKAFNLKGNSKTRKQFSHHVEKDLIRHRVDPEIIEKIIKGLDI